MARIPLAVVPIVCSLLLAVSGAAPAARGAHAASSVRASLQGRVLLRGPVPPAEVAPLDADPYCAAQHARPLTIADVEVGEDGGLRDVVVYLRDAPTDISAGELPEVVLEQSDCMYRPRTLVVRVGQTVVFRNDDQTLHNVHVEPTANPPFNLGQPFRGTEARRRFERPEVGIAVRCDVHAWMRATISVFPHPYYATTDADGRFSLPSPPAGRYTLEGWHDALGTVRAEIEVGAETEPIELVFE